ncbi:ATP-dependent rRNA helicase SPB4 [Frankliniella fusca]|uniref:ATP-dependent rRNA helicase SPB4 n=1 Tax=Frankliniella fusca TaxID=407009 RepID=A0AAE1H3E1_9NEOP|nr:ATP-dependent rRNA helicase SPB4 [Frankliniella fusca]
MSPTVRRVASDVVASAALVLLLLASADALVHAAPPGAAGTAGAVGVAFPADATLHGSVPAHSAPPPQPRPRRARSLLDDDLIMTGLNMITGASCSCRRLTLCDLAATLLQAIEANKAQDAETLRRRQQQPDYTPHPYRGLPGRYKRAGGQEDVADDDRPPNPTLLHITETFLRRLRDEEEANRREALRRAREALERAARAEGELHDYQDDGVADQDDDFARDLRNLNHDSDPSDAIQRIARHL